VSSKESAGDAETTLLSTPPTVNEIVGRRIARLRGREQVSQRALAARLTELGVSVDQARIARIEGGRVSLDLATAIAFAIALGVFLDQLIAPGDGEWESPNVQVTPGKVVQAEHYRQWLQGSTIAAEFLEMARATLGRRLWLVLEPRMPAWWPDRESWSRSASTWLRNPLVPEMIRVELLRIIEPPTPPAPPSPPREDQP
jgi:transcriptional regulator with XRE-family HTH domain